MASEKWSREWLEALSGEQIGAEIVTVLETVGVDTREGRVQFDALVEEAERRRTAAESA